MRPYKNLGFVPTPGYIKSYYRLFVGESLQCAQVVQGLRSLGLILKEIYVQSEIFLGIQPPWQARTIPKTLRDCI
jgi:hypothetical protein